jgi:hypothetical protein
MSDAGVWPEAQLRASGGDVGRRRSRIAAMAWLIGLGVLSGCASQRDDVGKQAWAYVPPPAVPLSQDAQEKFCKAVAAPSNDEVFDQPTRTRMYEVNYRQCLTFYTGRPDH